MPYMVRGKFRIILFKSYLTLNESLLFSKMTLNFIVLILYQALCQNNYKNNSEKLESRTAMTPLICGTG